MKLTYERRFLASYSLVSSRSTRRSQPNLIIEYFMYFIQNISYFTWKLRSVNGNKVDLKEKFEAV